MSRIRISRPNLSLVLSAVIIAILAAGAFVFTDNREWIGDDLLYQYVIDDETQPPRPLDNFGQLGESLYNHTLNYNGRLPVHFVVQLFAGILGKRAFAIANALVFIIFLFLTVRLIFGKSMLRHPAAWLIVGACVLLFFPGGNFFGAGPWYALAVSVNYLWVGVLFELFTLCFLRTGLSVSTAWLVVLGLFAGWSNEAFAVPLSGAVFLFLITGRKLTRKQTALAFALWAGTALLVLAPGNLVRIADASRPRTVMEFLLSVAGCYAGLIFIWLLAAALLAGICVRRAATFRFIAENRFLFFILCIGLPFSIYAHSSPHSLTCEELVSLILLGRLVRRSVRREIIIPVPLTALGALILAACIWRINICNSITVSDYRASLERYSASPDGVFPMRVYECDGPVRPFITRYDNYITPGWQTARHMERKYGNVAGCLPVMLDETDYRLLIEDYSGSFPAESLVAGSAAACNGGHYFLAPASAADSSGESVYTAYFDSDDFLESKSAAKRLIYKVLYKGRKPPKQLAYEVVRTRNGSFVLIEKILTEPTRIERTEARSDE